MKSNKKLKNNNKNTKIIKENINLDNLKSNYRLSIIFNNLRRKRLLELVKYNKKMQNRLNLNIKDYIEYCEIEIVIIPYMDKYGKFININENEKLFCHIYFNDNKKEIKNKYEIKEKDKISKIKIIIKYLIKN